jgi:hypothetical protein
MELAKIESKIFTIRGIQLILDRDLAELYKVDTKVLNQAVKRNINRFPEFFRFQLTKAEKDKLVTNFDRLESLKHSSSYPYVFKEQGVAMLSAVLRSDIAIIVSIQIMEAFVYTRKFLLNNASVFQRLDQIELKQLKTDEKIEQIFMALEAGKPEPDKGIFFDGQVFDAYVFVSGLIKNAKKSIILIDNYVDETVLLLLSKRNKNVTITIYTQNLSKQLQLDLNKHNSQYPEIKAYKLKETHDRFLIIDEKELYHFGASLKDLAKKWFAFSKMDTFLNDVLLKLKNK